MELGFWGQLVAYVSTWFLAYAMGAKTWPTFKPRLQAAIERAKVRVATQSARVWSRAKSVFRR